MKNVHFEPTSTTDTEKLMKTIFITGASSGIGFETARLFSERGWRVIAAIRKLSNAEPLKRMLGTEIV